MFIGTPLSELRERARNSPEAKQAAEDMRRRTKDAQVCPDCGEKAYFARRKYPYCLECAYEPNA